MTDHSLSARAAKPAKRKAEIVAISNVHPGTYRSHARELAAYLKSIRPKTLVLNGDIIDIWQFSRRYWPSSHMKVVKVLMNIVGKGTRVYYVTGGHDEMLRKFEGFRLGSFRIVNKVVLGLAYGQRTWIFHGDVFDVTMQHSRWLARLGAIGYDMLILLTRMAHFTSGKVFRKGKLSLSKRNKESVKRTVKFINSFEQTAANVGIANGYDFVGCGLIHQPATRRISNTDESILYLNSADWIENLAALEYGACNRRLHQYNKEDILPEDAQEQDPDAARLFNNMLEEFKLLKTK